MPCHQALCCVVVAKSRIMFDQSNIPPREKRQFACEFFFPKVADLATFRHGHEGRVPRRARQ
jgi:hypothetical protein